jgi:opacity protein-like surface antigen
MTVKLASLPLALLLATAAAAPALAGGDVIYQGVKTPGAAIPVPAPIPVEIYQPDYYVRADIGASWIRGGGVEETGTPMNMNDSIEAMEFGSLGFGRYVTPSIRVELAIDLYSRADLKVSNPNFNQDVRVDEGGGDVYDRHYDVTRQESIKYEQDLGMLNFYYDFRNASRFTPYIGAGIGVTYRQLSRTASEVADCTGTTIISGVPNPQCPDASVAETTQNKQRWDLALAAMAGFSYAINEMVWIDTSYRYLWQNADVSLSAANVDGASVVKVEDVSQHQIRTGIRLNIN